MANQNLTMPNIDVGVSVAKDAAENAQVSATLANKFNIDETVTVLAMPAGALDTALALEQDWLA